MPVRFAPFTGNSVKLPDAICRRSGPCNDHAAGKARQKTHQSTINFVRTAYRTNSAVDETLSLRIADARWVSRSSR